jgi:antitoxin component YwqK of YwqJK toxin-antitoxin module
MKTTKLFLLFFIIAQFAISQVKQNDKGLYANADGSLYTGTLETDENGAKKSMIEVKDGQINGEAKYYYADGKLMEIGTFENGMKSGKWIRYNESGTMIGLASYKLGKKNGTWLVWDDNGKKRFEMTYKDGEKSGVWNQWDEKGDLLASKDYGQVN